MKKLILILLLTVMANTLFAQIPMNWGDNDYHTRYGYNFDFNADPDSSVYYFHIDHSQFNNIWQTGTVDKPYFTSGAPGPRAMVTDTIHSYPVNNTSSFTFSIINCPGKGTGLNYTAMEVQFDFSINTDSLKDGGTVEVSHNNGLTWTNVIDDTSTLEPPGGFYSADAIVKSLGKPGFSGTYKYGTAGMYFKPRFPPNIDTVTFRFTFASDSIQKNKDGWMVSYVYTRPYYEGIDEKYKSNLMTVFPNPTQSDINIKINYPLSPESNLHLENNLGQTVKELKVNKQSIHIGNLTSGMYFVKYNDGKYFSIKKVIVTK